MLIDDITIVIHAGSGGDGLAVFNKNKMSLGPTGGDGGNGGNIFVEGVSNIGALSSFRGTKEFFAQNGKQGKGQRKDGQSGKDLVLTVPVGTIIHDLENSTKIEIKNTGQITQIAKGGTGGRGNFSFRSSRLTTPTKVTLGQPGESFKLHLELKLIADIGFVGFPNAGKSTLLNSITNAQSKVANYPFTTLEPHLGVYYELILADIPGLIKGASSGKGLGIKFLRHIERTKILFHFVSAESKNPAKDYQTLKTEIGKYNKNLLEKKEYVFLSKCDNTNKKDLKQKLATLKKLNQKTYPLSILMDETIENMRRILNQIKNTK